MSIRDVVVPPQTPHDPAASNGIMLVGEAPGQEEVAKRSPFVGSSGQELTRMLRDAGINRAACYITNVFDFKLPGNDVGMICTSKKDAGADYAYPAIAPGKYLMKEYFDVLVRLKEEIQEADPCVIIPLGNTALWALAKLTGISKYRGTVLESRLAPGRKCLPTFHPAAILRQWDNRVVCIADFIKARSQSHFREIRRPARTVWLDPTIEDLRAFKPRLAYSDAVAVDIETARGRFVTCIGFAPERDLALVIPFVDRRREGYSYWGTVEEELSALMWVREVLEDGTIPKVFQNGLYDLQYIWRVMRIKPRGCEYDTMLTHHSLYSEMEKSLGFLGSVYTDEASWKQMRPRGFKTEKADE